MEFSQDEIRQQYDKEAPWYDFHVSTVERLTGITRLRRELLRKATGNVLEIAVGTGRTCKRPSTQATRRSLNISGAELHVYACKMSVCRRESTKQAGSRNTALRRT